MGYAVVDLETTGLSPRNDRIVEIGVVVLDDSGEAEDEWSSLVNPERSMRATFIHGLTDADVTEAPALADLLPRIRATFAGRALVAHNASFDVGFLNASFARAGYGLHIPREATVCTMELSKIYLPPGKHGLKAAAERAGVSMPKHHRALADAHTAAGLLRHYLNAEASGTRYAGRACSREGEITRPASWIEARKAAEDLSWPDFLF